MNLLKCLCIGLSSVLLAGIAVSPVSAATEGVPEYLLVSCNSSWTGVRCDHTTVPHDQSNGGLIDGKNLCIEGDHIGYADSGDIFCIGTVDFGDGAYNTIAMTASNTDSGGGTVKVFLDMDPESLAPEFTGQEICSIPITKSGGWSNFVEMTGSIAERVTGKHKVYILLGGSINVRSFGFSYSNAVPDRITIPCNSSWTGVRCEHHNNPGDMNNGGLIEGSNLQIEGDHIGWADAGDIFCIGEVEFGEAAYAVASMSASNPSNEEDRFTETGKPITDPSGNPCTVDLYIDMDENSATPEKTGTKIASIPVIASGGWATYINMDGKLSSVSGTHKVYVLLGYSLNIKSFSFHNGGDIQTGLSEDIMNLENLPADTGVPLGGIGTGCFGFSPDGRFTRVMLNNTEQDYLTGNKDGFLFAAWDSASKSARRLQRDNRSLFGMRGYANSTYTGLFPTARMTPYDQKSAKLETSIYAYSPLVPQDVKNSSLPVAWFEVELKNNSSQEMETSVAFSFEDVIGRGIKDPDNLDNVLDNMTTVNGSGWPAEVKTDTKAQSITVGGYKGIRQYAEQPIEHLKDTHQNYNTDVLLLADTGVYDTDGNQTDNAEIGMLASYNPGSGDNAWSSFRENGTFQSTASTTALSTRDNRAAASIVSAKAVVPANSTRKVRFMVTWYAPEQEKKTGHAKASYGTADFNKYYHNSFENITQLTQYCAQNRQELLDSTLEWQQPILDSNMPDWLKFRLINSGYVLYTNSILNKAGSFTSMEGGMMGLTGTADQRLSSHPVYQKLFPELDRSENLMFQVTRGSNGRIMHFTGNYYVGIGDTTKQSESPMTGNGWMIDNSMSWMIQMAKEYQNTGDEELLEQIKPVFDKLVPFLKSCIHKADGITLQIPQGPTTYDDRSHPAVMSYSGSTYLAALNASKVIAQASGDSAMVAECENQIALTQESMNSDAMFNGQYYAYGYGREEGLETGRIDYVFSGMLAGQFLSRYSGWDDILPHDNILSSIQTQLQSALQSPGYYLAKVYDPVTNTSKDNAGSECWPFYLESYTAMLAIQNGSTADGLRIMENIQKIHLERGLNWSMNLWQPGPVTYMTSPVTWFITDVLSGMSVDVPNKTLTVGPTIIPGEQTLTVPVYYPEFWGEFTYDRSKKTASLTITKTFTDSPASIETIRVRPNGLPDDEAKTFTISPFALTEGAVLTFTGDMVECMNKAQTQKEILPDQPPIAYEQTADVPLGDGTGLRSRFSNSTFQAPVVGRTGDNVAFHTLEQWNLPEGIDPRNLGVAFDGKIQMLYGGIPEYRFFVQSNGGVRLWVDGKLIIDAAGNKENTLLTSEIISGLEPGEQYSIELEFTYKGNETPVCELQWLITPHNAAAVPKIQLYPNQSQMGDVNQDGSVDSVDALTVLRSNVGLETLSPQSRELADMNGDGEIDSVDALSILQVSVGIKK